MGVKRKQYSADLEKNLEKYKKLSKAHKEAVKTAAIKKTKKDPLKGLTKLARAKRKLKMAITGKLPASEHSAAGQKHLTAKAKAKTKQKQTARTTTVTSELKKAGLSEKEIAKLRGKK